MYTEKRPEESTVMNLTFNSLLRPKHSAFMVDMVVE